MKKSIRKSQLFKRIGLGFIVILLLFLVSRDLVFKKIKSAILAEISTLENEGFTIRYQSLASNSWNNKVNINVLEIEFPESEQDCSKTLHLTIDNIQITGIEIIPLIFDQEIRLTNVVLKKLIARRYRALRVQDKKGLTTLNVREIVVNHLQLDSAKFEQFDSVTCRLTAHLGFSLSVADVHVREPGKVSMTWVAGEVTITNLRVLLPQQFYTLTLQRFSYSPREKLIRMDSFLIVPDFSKAAFALKTGSQTDRLTGSVPCIEISGVEIETYKDFAFRAPHASLNFELSVFRDKRFPLSGVRIKPLPSQILNNLPFKFQVDTLKLLESSIVYEEYPSGGNESGIVSFKGLTALVTNASNMSHENMVMHARARFMNEGDLRADLTFPPNPKAPYTAKGSLSNFNLPDINPMLIPAARTEIKAGWLKSLTFEFVYNDYRADGLLTMNYTNLEVISLTKHL